MVKESAWNAGDMGLIPGSGRSPGEGNDNPLQNSCLENPMDRGAWKATSPRGHKESDMTEQLKHFHSIQVIRALPVFLPAGLIASLTTWWIWSSGAYMLFLQMPAHQQVLLLLFRHSVVFESLRPHGLQHNRLPCPSLSPRVCSNSCPLSR